MPHALAKQTAEAAPLPQQTEWTPSSIEAVAYAKAAKYHLPSAPLFVSTMSRESWGFTDPKIQSHAHRLDGSREPSFGVCQFYLPSSLTTASGTPITYEIAVDPERCLDAAAYQFSIGNASQWTEYRKLTR